MKTNVFLKSAIITLIIVIFTFLLASQMDYYRTNEIREKIDEISFEGESNRLMKSLTEEFKSENKCELIKVSKEYGQQKAYELALKLEDYQKANFFNNEYEMLKKRYFISLVDLFLFTMQQNRECPLDKQVIILFFYKENNCPECKTQGSILDSVSEKCTKIRIFAFPADIDYPFLRVIKKEYKIEKAPAIIIEQKTKFEGLTNEQTIIKELTKYGAECK
jgi:hypothetical protein